MGGRGELGSLGIESHHTFPIKYIFIINFILFKLLNITQIRKTAENKCITYHELLEDVTTTG